MDEKATANAETGILKSGTMSRTKTGGGHRILQSLLILVAVLLAAGLMAYGWEYYLSGLTDRPYSPQHPILKSGGDIGIRLGIAGLALFALVFLYPLRKHWALLGRIGETKNWFSYHVILGLTAPFVVTLHSAFKLHGFAGMAYWTMWALVGSGIVGRYFYAQIPRNIDAAEMSLQQMQELKSAMMDELKRQRLVELSKVEQIFHLPDADTVRSMSLVRVLIYMVSLDLSRHFRTRTLRRSLSQRTHKNRNSEIERVIELASKEAALSKRILFLSRTQRIFHMWHVVHRPFSISFAVFLMIHVTIVLWLGYY